MARGPTEPLSRAFLITIPRPAHRIGNFHFAFPATGQYTPIRLRSRSFYIGSKAKAPVVRDTALAGTKKAMICPIPQRFLGHFSLNLLRRPDGLRLLAKPTRLAAVNPPSAAPSPQTGASSGGSPPALAMYDNVGLVKAFFRPLAVKNA